MVSPATFITVDGPSGQVHKSACFPHALQCRKAKRGDRLIEASLLSLSSQVQSPGNSFLHLPHHIDCLLVISAPPGMAKGRRAGGGIEPPTLATHGFRLSYVVGTKPGCLLRPAAATRRGRVLCLPVCVQSGLCGTSFPLFVDYHHSQREGFEVGGGIEKWESSITGIVVSAQCPAAFISHRF